MVIDIAINNRHDVERLNAAVCKTNEPFWVHSNDGTIMVDARSLLAMYMLIGKPCKLVGEDSCNPKTLARVARRAGV